MSARRGLGAALLLALAACGSAGEGAPPAPSGFTIRGRLAAPRNVRWRLDPSAHAPLDGARTRGVILRALDAWRRASAGRVAFVETPRGPLDVRFSWQRGAHGGCRPFGQDTSVAHTGPMDAAPTFVHLDAGRPWREAGHHAGPALYAAVLHEAGHVLGLGHDKDMGALMFAAAGVGVASAARARITRAERDGLASLYGGASAAPGDLWIGDAEGAPWGVVHGVARGGTSRWALLDTDADGRDELALWRTGRAGHGALMLYHFSGPGALTRTTGPFLGLLPQDREAFAGRAPDGSALLAWRDDAGGSVARVFGADGQPAAPRPLEGALPLAQPERGDLDGDGKQERVRVPGSNAGGLQWPDGGAQPAAERRE